MGIVNKTTVVADAEHHWVLLDKSGYRLVLVHVDDYVFAASIAFYAHDCVPFIPYVYQGKNNEDAYERYICMTGKIVLKFGSSSRYFARPNLREHCLNGRPRRVPVSEWESRAQSILTEIRSELMWED